MKEREAEKSRRERWKVRKERQVRREGSETMPF